MFAKTENTSPFMLRLENTVLLPEELLVFTGDMKQKLKVGDRVVLLRKSGGQQYVVQGVIS